MVKLIKALKITFVLCLMVGFIWGFVYIINKEETETGRYTIKTDREYFKTNAYTIDSNNCINFTAHESVLIGPPKTKAVQICGGRYIIEEKWKR